MPRAAVKRVLVKVRGGALKDNAANLLRNLVVVSLTKEDYDLETLSGITGVKALQLAPFLTKYMDQGFIEPKKDGTYTVTKK